MSEIRKELRDKLFDLRFKLEMAKRDPETYAQIKAQIKELKKTNSERNF